MLLMGSEVIHLIIPVLTFSNGTKIFRKHDDLLVGCGPRIRHRQELVCVTFYSEIYYIKIHLLYNENIIKSYKK